MKFSADPKLLERPVRLVSGVVDSRPIHPHLANLLIEADGSQLSLIGTNLEVEVRAQVELPNLSAPEPMQFTVSAKKLADALSALSSQSNVEFDIKPDKVILKSGKNTYRFAALPPEGVHLFEPEANPDVSFSVSARKLLSLLKRTAFAMAQKDTRHFLNGMLFEVTPYYFRVVSTDGHRLAQCTLAESSLETGVSEDMQAIVPRKAVLEMMRLLENEDSNAKAVATLSIGEQLIVLDVDNKQLKSKLVDGKYPKYDRVIPKTHTNTLICARGQLKEACRRATVLFNEGHGGVQMHIENDEHLSFLSQNSMDETAEIYFEGQYKGDVLDIAFKAAYLQDVMGVMDGEKVSFKLQDSNSSALIEDPNQDDVLYVIMPLRI